MRRLMRPLLLAVLCVLVAGVVQAAIDPATAQKLIADADYFGTAVSVSGDTAVIGAAGDHTQTGSAYVFTHTAGVWSQQQKLTANNGVAHDWFGSSVSLSGDSMIIGAYGDDGYQGSAYIFTRTGGVWSQQAKLIAGDANPYDWFGWSVSVSGDTAIIGAYWDDGAIGSAYVFTRTGGVWSQQAKLIAGAGNHFDWFGYSVSVSGDTAIIGAIGDGDGETGTVYVFTRTGGVWTQQAKLIAGDGDPHNWFGWSVSVSGDTAVIGANGNDSYGYGHKGSVYVFTRTGEAWSQQAKLQPADVADSDLFGSSVSVSGDIAVVGAYSYDSLKGSAYVFTRTDGVWSQQTKLLAAGGAAGDLFGYSVSVDGDTAAVGAIGTLSYNKGFVYVYPGHTASSTSPAPWLPLLLK